MKLESQIQKSIEDGVYTITLNRPEKLNSMRLCDFERLYDLIEDFRTDVSATVLVITGKGRAFCAGEDLNELTDPEEVEIEAVRRRVEKLQAITELLYAVDKPTVAAVNGLAVGFGLEITLACDIRIAAAEAYFWFSEVKRGLLPTNGSFYLLPRLIGLANTAEMMLLSRKTTAQRAKEIGLISEVVSDGKIYERAKELAIDMQGGSHPALMLTKTMLRDTVGKELSEVLKLEVEGTLELAHKGEVFAGAKAFTARDRVSA